MDEKELLAAVQSFFGDTSRLPSETKDGLRSARDLIDTLIETIHDEGEEDDLGL